MIKIKFVLFFVGFLLITGCTTTLTAQAPVENPTANLQSPSPLLPTATIAIELSTPTLEPPLQTNGPYFTYLRDVDGTQQIIMMDANGKGRKVISLPEGIANSLSDKKYNLNLNLISPDGKWMAFYTGFVDSYSSEAVDGAYRYDLALNLLDLATGEIQVITRLLSDDYPNNFAEAEKKINEPGITASTLREAFLNGITQAIAWAPEGGYLAFAGQMDGLSSDLYLYDVENAVIRRLSDGDKEIQSLDWSPNGDWILHSSVYKVGVGMKYDIYSAAVNGSSVKYLSSASSDYRIWVNSSTYLEHDNENVFGDFGFRLVDLNTGHIYNIWDGPVMSYDLNVEKGKFAVAAHMFPQSPYVNRDQSSDFVPGLYLIDVNTYKVTNIKLPNGDDVFGYYINSFGLEGNSFSLTGFGLNQKPYLLSDADELLELDFKGAKYIESSPDASCWIVVTDKAINVYSPDNIQIGSISLPFLDVQRTFFVWKPDSSGLFLLYNTNIYSLNIATGEISLIDDGLLDNFWGSRYMWINIQ